MSYFYLLLTSFLALAIGTVLVRVLSWFIWWKPARWFFALRIDFLWIWGLTVLILFTHPLQNWFLVGCVTATLYLVINLVCGTGTVGTQIMGLHLSKSHAINTRRRILLLLLYFVLAVTITSGKSMLSGFNHTQSPTSILLSSQGSLAVDIHDVGTYDLVVHDHNHDKQIDELRYDINKDGKVDLIVEQGPNGMLNREVVSYLRQARLLVYIGVVILLLALLRYTKYKRKRQNDQQTAQHSSLQMQMMIWVLIILGASFQPVHALTLGEAHKALITHPKCAQEPQNNAACKDVNDETLLFFAHLDDPLFLKTFRSYLQDYTACVQQDCTSQQLAQLDIEFNTWRQDELVPEGNYDKASYTTQSMPTSLSSLTNRHKRFEQITKNLIDQIESHRRRENFQTELAATNYISQETMLELQVEFDKRRELESSTIDLVMHSLLKEITRVSRQTSQGFRIWLVQQDPDPQLKRQLTRLHKLNRSMRQVTLYQAITEQELPQDISPYMLFTAIGVGEQIVRMNPRDLILTSAHELYGRMGTFGFSRHLPTIALTRFVSPKLVAIAATEYETLDSNFQHQWIEMIAAWDDSELSVVDKGKAFIVAARNSLAVGTDLLLHEILFMSEDYLLTRQQTVADLNKAFTYW